MKVKERKALGGYIRYVANELQLRDWTIHLSHRPCEDGLGGTCICERHQREATLSFADDFRDREATWQRETVVHELLHCHHEACWRMVQTDLNEPLGKVAYYVFCDAYRANMELMIDALAKTLAPRMPPIDWP